jgi:hypothetical protein
MADLIVEDGTGFANANSYISVEEADAYHDDRGNTRWADYDENDVKIPALIRAADYIQQIYGSVFSGYPAATGQGLAWPRMYSVDTNVYGGSYFDPTFIPPALKKAQAELALDAVSIAGKLIPLLADSTSSTKKRIKAGPIEIERFEGRNSLVLRNKIDGMLVSLLAGGLLNAIPMYRG